MNPPAVPPVVEDVVEPLVGEVVAPVVEDVVEPLVEDVVAPVVEDVVAPVVEDVVAPLVEDVGNAAPVTQVVETATDALGAVAGDAVGLLGQATGAAGVAAQDLLGSSGSAQALTGSAGSIVGPPIELADSAPVAPAAGGSSPPSSASPLVGSLAWYGGSELGGGPETTGSDSSALPVGAGFGALVPGFTQHVAASAPGAVWQSICWSVAVAVAATPQLLLQTLQGDPALQPFAGGSASGGRAGLEAAWEMPSLGLPAPEDTRGGSLGPLDVTDLAWLLFAIGGAGILFLGVASAPGRVYGDALAHKAGDIRLSLTICGLAACSAAGLVYILGLSN